MARNVLAVWRCYAAAASRYGDQLRQTFPESNETRQFLNQARSPG